jgi:outer membrane protein assembly factor BamB
MGVRYSAAFAVILLAAACSLRAADYPQWRGPGRDGISKDTGLLKQWPEDGPRLLWKVDKLGGGYSTPAVANGKIFVCIDKGGKEGKEYAVALDVKNGQEIWSTELGKVGPNQLMKYPGARSTPTVDGGNVYCLGSDGDLACLDVANGTVKWKKNYKADFGGKAGMWAYSESPLVDGEVVIGTPGGEKAALVALNKNTGAVVWQCTVPSLDKNIAGEPAGYASIIIAQTGGVKQYVQFLHDGVVGVDAKTGKFLWRDSRAKDIAANIPTAIFHDGYVFSGGGRTSGALVKLTAADGGVEAKPIYLEKKLATGIGGAIRLGDHLYLSGNGLVCAEFATGKVLWQDKSVGAASLCYADGHLYLHAHRDGTVALVEASPAAYKEKGRFTPTEVTANKAWTYPVVANGRLYIRDQDVLCCYDVKDPAAK